MIEQFNQGFYAFALWLDGLATSTALHESYYMYNWVETTHVLSLMISLGLLLLIDLRMLGIGMSNIPARALADRLHWPMLLGFGLTLITGVLLFYAIPVRTSQSLWFRIKLVLLLAAFLNAVIFNYKLRSFDPLAKGWPVPGGLRLGAIFSITFWVGIVICGRLIAYDWFDCRYNPGPMIGTLAGCIEGQEVF